MDSLTAAARRRAAARRCGPLAPCILCVATLLFAACGPVGSGGTGAPAGAAVTASFAQGPVNGFGSILVDGVHYDEATATVVDDDGEVLSAQIDLHLGSTVDVQAAPVADSAASASLIRVRTDLVGPVTTGLDASTLQLGVLGQVVAVDPSTTFVDNIARGFAGLEPGMVVEVSSLYDAVSGIYHATRIAPRPAATAYAVRGAIEALGAGSVQIGTQTFDYGALATPSDFRKGQIVRLTLATTPTDQGHWVATAVTEGVTLPADGGEGDLRGAIGRTLDARHAFVGGVLVDAGSAVLAPADHVFATGELVEVHGRMSGAVLVAQRVDFQVGGTPAVGSGAGASRYDTGFQIDGQILAPVDPAGRTFVMRGPTTVDYAHASFTSGSAADLAMGRRVQVRGKLSSDGTRLVASTIGVES